MPKPYHKRKTSRSTRSNIGNSFAWVVFGIMLGLFLAIIGYWKLSAAPNHSSSSFTRPIPAHPEGAPKKPKAAVTPEFDFYTVLPKMQVAPSLPSKAVPPAAPRPPAVEPLGSVPAATAGAALETAPPISYPLQHDKLAPKITAPNVITTVPPPVMLYPAPKAVEAKPAMVKEASAKNNEAVNYLLQMASFKNYVEADRLKAQLTMLGFDVYIQSYNLNGSVYNRVVIGPYPSKSMALQQQTQLQKSHVTSILIKAP